MKTVNELMHKHMVGVAETANVDTALKLMRTAHVALIPVIKDSRLVGILTKSTAERFESEADTKRIKEIMSKPVFVELDTPLEDAAKMMIESSMPRMPVVNNGSEMICVGMITSTEVVKEVK